MTRDEIMQLKIGDKLSNTLDSVPFTQFRKVQPDARWSQPREIVEIVARSVSEVTGEAYIIGYTKFGDNNSSISFSIAEGEVVYRKVA